MNTEAKYGWLYKADITASHAKGNELDLNTAAVVLALILGPIGEKGLRNALRTSRGDISVLFSSVVCWVLIALCVVGILSPIFMNKLEKKAEKDATGLDPDDKKPVDLDVDND